VSALGRVCACASCFLLQLAIKGRLDVSMPLLLNNTKNVKVRNWRSADVIVVYDHLAGTLRHPESFSSLAPVTVWRRYRLSVSHLLGSHSSVPFRQTIYRLSPESCRSAPVSPLPDSPSTSAITAAQVVTVDPVAPSRFAGRHSEVYLPSWKSSTDDVIGARLTLPVLTLPPQRMPRHTEYHSWEGGLRDGVS